MTEADLGTKPSRASRNSDAYLNIALVTLLVVVLGVGSWFGYTVYRDRQMEFNSSATGRLVEVLRQAVRKSPNDAAIRVRYGEALGAMGKYQDSIEQFNAALKIDPKHEGAYLDLGMVAMLNKDNGAAERYFQKVVSLSDDSQYAAMDQMREQAYYNLGLLMLDEKRYTEAAGFLKGALAIRNDASDSYYQLAKAYQGLGDIDSAISQLEMGLQFDPGFAEAHYYLGELFKLKKDDANASYQFAEAVRLAPDADQPKQALEAYGQSSDWVAKARAALAAGSLNQAITDAVIARNLDQKDFAAAKLHADLLLQSGNLKGALASYQDAALIRPADPVVRAQVKALLAKIAAMPAARKAAAKRSAPAK